METRLGSGKISKLTQVRFNTLSIPVRVNRVDVEGCLTRSLLGTLPGFILREATKDALGITSHKDLVEFIQEVLLIKEAEFTAGPTKSKAKPNGIGDLHTDGVEVVKKVLNFNVHTTERGSGGILLALPGSKAKAIIDAEGRAKPGFGTLAVRSAWERPLHHLALRGQTYAELIDPSRIFTGRVEQGDSAVIALESSKGPMFHRFDTDTTDREASITELNRPE